MKFVQKVFLSKQQRMILDFVNKYHNIAVLSSSQRQGSVFSNTYKIEADNMVLTTTMQVSTTFNLQDSCYDVKGTEVTLSFTRPTKRTDKKHSANKTLVVYKAPIPSRKSRFPSYVHSIILKSFAQRHGIMLGTQIVER